MTTTSEADDRLLYSKTDARRLLGGIGNTKLWELVTEGRLNQVNIGRRSFITAESLCAYVDRLSGDGVSEATGAIE